MILILLLSFATACTDAEIYTPDAGSDAGAGIDSGGALDSGEACGTDPCDPIAQCGCSTEQVCEIDSMGDPVCGARGDQALGDDCDNPEDDRCQPGTMCRRGLCHRLCTIAADDCPGDGARCELVAFGQPPYGTCSMPCTPVPQGGCDEGRACIVAGAAGDITDCSVAGTGTDGIPCGHDPRVCALGFQCSPEMPRLCRKLCRDGVDGDCDAAAPTCMVIPGFGIIRGVHYGLCV
jgi:hypothetical protein